MLIHRNRLIRHGLKTVLQGSSLTVVGEADRLGEGLAAIATGIRADLVLLDGPASAEQEREAVQRLRAVLPKARLVVLASESSPQRLTNAFQSGIDGYLMDNLAPGALVQSLQLVMMGEKVFPTQMTAPAAAQPTNGHHPAALAGLSPRETQTLRCLANGDSNKQIAARLSITEGTVKVHVRSLMRKIRAGNRTQAAIWALNTGLATAAAAE
ncbi:MAG: response regulator transcription factor [Rhodospirillales bacterium]|nr:response regulator transcription factor [Rhodospirillales bacterium]